MAQKVTFNITPEQEASKLQFLRRQFSSYPPAVSRSDVDLSTKTAIVTGASGGIGLECARELLGLGLSRLILTARNEAKGEAARRALAADTKPGQTVEVWMLDYSSYPSITEFARRAEGLEPHIVVLNAAINRGSFVLNPSTGHEENMQTNYLSTALLVMLMLRVFQKSKDAAAAANPSKTYSPGRIVIVSSDTAAWAAFAEKDGDPLLPAFDQEAMWTRFGSYPNTKLLGQLFVAELARRVPPSLAIVNCANPGLCYGSDLAREVGTLGFVFTRLLGRPAAIGARVLVHAATKQGERSHGQYVEDGELRP